MSAQPRRVYVVGVGMTPFVKPGNPSTDYPEMVGEAVAKALKDASVTYDKVQQACVGYVYADSTSGQRALYELGMSGIPIYNVNNNCSTGSTALYMAYQLIRGGNSDCALAVGFEKMERGSLSSKFPDRTNPLDKHVEILVANHGFEPAPVAAQLFGSAGREHMKKYGTRPEHFEKIAYKNHRNSVRNPYSQFREEYSLEQIAKSPSVYPPLTKLQCCPTSDGSAAAILVSEKFVKAHGLENRAVEILGMEMATDVPTTFSEQSSIKMVGFDMTKHAANKLFQNAGMKPSDVDVVELHDCFSINELITYEALGLCDVGKGGEMVDLGDNDYGGKFVVNPSGGLISKGHPLGATGIAQCAELCWHLRNEAGERQVRDANIALQHNIGLGGAVVVALYKRASPTSDGQQELKLPQEMTKLKSSSFFSKLAGPLIGVVEKALDPKIKGSVRLKVKDDDSNYVATGVLEIDHGKLKIHFDPKSRTDCTISIADGVLNEILFKKNSFENAFFTGKVKIQGNVGFLMKFLHLKNTILSKL